MTLGVQVIARGAGKFDLVGYSLGLPGDGCYPGLETSQYEGGQLSNGEVRFIGEVEVKVKDGIMTIRNDGKMIGECKKIIRKSPTLGEKPPAGAVVLFDGKSADQFTGSSAKDNLLDRELLVQGIQSKQKFQNFRLHLEFLLSYMPTERGQQRSNSGCYCQGRYEVQILDSFGLKGDDHECGRIYGVQ